MESTLPTTVAGERSPFEIGFMTFAEIIADPATGTLPSAHQRARETIEQARLADEAGLDLFAVGEHHRTDVVGSAPSVVLTAAAQAATNIRLTSAVTVLSSDDPVRVWEQIATLDQLSGGRAEIIAGRGSCTKSPADHRPVPRSRTAGRARPRHAAHQHQPPRLRRAYQPGRPRHDVPLLRAGHDGQQPPAWPRVRDAAGRHRSPAPNAGLVVGSPHEVIEKLLAYHELYGLDRALIQIGFGGMPQQDVLKAIELLGAEVAPVVRREVGSRKEQAA